MSEHEFAWAMNMCKELKPSKPRGRPIKGPDMQRLLSIHLKKFIPYVITETSNARYDVVAYLPEEIVMRAPPKAIEEVPCIFRYNRDYCGHKLHDIANLAHEAAREEMRKDRRGWGERAGLSHGESLHHEGYNYIWNGKKYTKKRQLFFDVREECKCVGRECEIFKQQGRRLERSKFRDLPPGLHIMEIKSDKDTPDRLVHQVPQMMELADYVWLVLGDRQPVPEWLPPFVGIMRFGGGEWIIERYPNGPLHTPALYWQCLHGYGLGDAEARRIANVLHKVKKMERAWMINSIFHFDNYPNVGHGVIVDMTTYIGWANDLRMKAVKVAGDKKRLVPEIERFFDELGEAL